MESYVDAHGTLPPGALPEDKFASIPYARIFETIRLRSLLGGIPERKPAVA